MDMIYRVPSNFKSLCRLASPLFPWLLKMQVEKLLHSIVILFTSQPKIGRQMDFTLSISFPTPKWNNFLLNSKMAPFPFYEDIKDICTIQSNILHDMI